VDRAKARSQGEALERVLYRTDVNSKSSARKNMPLYENVLVEGSCLRELRLSLRVPLCTSVSPVV
jgi:hypothetical protein